jgi:site-specific recombinase XerD
VAETTADDYEMWIQRFFDWFDGGPITEGVLIDFDDALQDTDEVPWNPGIAEYAYQTRQKALSAVMLWARKMEGEHFESDVGDLVMGEPADFQPTVLDESEVQAVLEQPCDNPGCKAARHLGYEAIMRCKEISLVQPQDLNPEENTVYIRAVKGSVSRDIGVGARTMDILLEQRERIQQEFNDPSYLFYNKYRLPWSADAWGNHFRRNHHEAGFHAFAKHTPITRRLEDGEPFGEVWTRARHAHPEMTSRYCSIAGREKPEWV